MLTERDPQTELDDATVHRVVRGPSPGRRRLLTRFVAFAAVPVALVGALVAWSLVASDASDDRMLIVDDEGAISLLDTETGTSLYRVPGAVATPDRSALLTTRDAADGGTVLESRDPGSGSV